MGDPSYGLPGTNGAKGEPGEAGTPANDGIDVRLINYYFVELQF